MLDMLAGSNSLTNTVISQLKLRIISLLGLVLIVTWALSPIGGQASFRQISIGNKFSTESAVFTYMIPNGNMLQYDDSDRESYWGNTNAQFVASVISSAEAKASTVDLWGNVKIPMIEPYENSSTKDSHEWFSVETNTTYSSLVGIPLAGITNSSFANYTMSMQTSYLYLDCPVVYGTDNWIAPNNTAFGTGAFMWTADNNITQRYETFTTDPAALGPLVFTYVSWGPTGYSQCSMTTTYVEVDITCSVSSSCKATRIRRSALSNPPPAFTLMDAEPIGWEYFSLPFATSISAHPNTPTVVQYYLVGPEDPVSLSMSATASKVPRITSEVYATRLGQLVNSYWTSLNAMRAITGGMTPETAFMAGVNVSDGITFRANSSTVIGMQTTSTQVIQSHEGWVATLLVASIVMIVASLVHPIAHYFFIHIPDLMLNISSLAVRDNPYVSVRANGTFMGASERAKLLKNLKVQFGDVNAGAETGRLAFGSVDPPGPYRMASIRNTRLYE